MAVWASPASRIRRQHPGKVGRGSKAGMRGQNRRSTFGEATMNQMSATHPKIETAATVARSPKARRRDVFLGALLVSVVSGYAWPASADVMQVDLGGTRIFDNNP